MAVLHDFKCAKHGYFESMAEFPSCPMKGCEEEVAKVFLQAPGLMSDKTKKSDKTIKQLAMDFDMTNIKSTREGENQAGYYTRKNKTSSKELEKETQAVQEQRREPRPGDAALWGNNAGMNMKQVLSGGAFRSVAGESVGVNPKDVGNLTGPRVASYIPDHENLTISK
jgi:hypothetical protein